MTDEEQKRIFARNLNNLVVTSGKTQHEISQDIGVSPQTFNTWIRGQALPRMGKIQRLADYFNISKADLIDDTNAIYRFSNISPIEKQKIPMLGEISCGLPRYANESWESYVEAGTNIHADFCLRASGDSMVNARINDGDIVFIHKQSAVENGQIAAVEIDDEATLKRVYYYRDANLLILRAENPAYEDLTYQGEELNQVHILGEAIAFQSSVI